MKAHIISLFPEIVDAYLSTSIMRIAVQAGAFAYELHNLADFSVRNTRRVDRRPYG